MAKINITFNGTTYSIDENKLVDAYSKLSLTFTELTKIPSPSKGLAYTLNDDEASYSVTGIGTCTDTDIIIPSEYEGLPVTRIDHDAFNKCTSLTSIVIPDSVTSIAWSVFWDCFSLTSVTIPNSVTSIDTQAFYGCTSLKSITIPDGVTQIEDYLFSGCTALTSIDIPTSVTGISDAFAELTKLSIINYAGTIEQWNNIYLNPNWDAYKLTIDPMTGTVMDCDYLSISINCTDGTISNR